MDRYYVARVVLLALLAVPALSAAEPLLSQLRPGEKIHVTYSTKGCEVADSSVNLDFEREKTIIARLNSHRAVPLSQREVTGLDKLFRFYRTRPVGFCTTTEEVTIVYFRNGRAVSREHYIDETCETLERKDITHLFDIVRKCYRSGR